MVTHTGALRVGIVRRIAGVSTRMLGLVFPTEISHTDAIGNSDDHVCDLLMLQGFSDDSDVNDKRDRPLTAKTGVRVP
jgi:hypothetical protein